MGVEASLRLLYVVTEDWYFLSHRLPMARAARDAGFEVHVATRVVNGGEAIRAEGFTLHPVPFIRGQLSPSGTIATIRALKGILRKIEPAIAHHVALQTTVLGSIAARGRQVNCVNALTGMGYTFTSGSAKALLLRPILSILLRLLLNGPRQTVLIQNPDDRDGMLSLGIKAKRMVLIPGSGVDVDALRPMPEPASPVTIAFVGRLLDDKGIRTLIRAHALLRQRGSQVELLIAGTPDPANPASVSEQEARAWGQQPGITWLGHVEDISTVWSRAHIAVLPSRREGLPLSLLEAAACGRPMIATDVPGCREIVRPNKTGVLVPCDDDRALADAIELLAQSPERRARYGATARNLVVEKFSAAAIGRQTVDLYRSLTKA
jgi:glycosyltransferase involved in cell wall biosynthesis